MGTKQPGVQVLLEMRAATQHLHDLVAEPRVVALLQAHKAVVELVPPVGVKSGRHQDQVRAVPDHGRQDLVPPGPPPPSCLAACRGHAKAKLSFDASMRSACSSPVLSRRWHPDGARVPHLDDQRISSLYIRAPSAHVRSTACVDAKDWDRILKSRN